jgi:tRNA (cmo5U34)-methyltransferase
MPKSDTFEFDEEVAMLFPNMAQRSIPNYSKMHSIHVKVAVDYICKHLQGYVVEIVDIGASHGDFASKLMEAMNAEHIKYHVTLVDESEAMCEAMNARFMNHDSVEVVCGGLGKSMTARMKGKAHITVCHYVAQFVDLPFRYAFLEYIAAITKTDGLLLWGEKEDYGHGNARRDTVIETMKDMYNRFRLDNGYSQEEIDIKTAALANSMWPVPSINTQAILKGNGFGDSVPTFRFGEFHSWVMVK